MSGSPIVSVIIPVHNSELYLRQCIDSVLGQTLHDIEIICVNDASTDSSEAILHEYEAANSYFKVFSQASGGAGAARNLGLRQSVGRYLCFLDSDDFFEQDMLEKAVERAEETKSDIVVYGAWLFDENRKANRHAKWLLQTDFLPKEEPFSPNSIADHLFNVFGNYTWNKLFSADFIKSEGIEFQQISRTNDLLFTCTALAKANRISTITQCFTHYRVSICTSLQATNDRDPLSFVKAFDALYDFLETNKLMHLYGKSYFNHFIDAICYNSNSMKTLSGLMQIKDAVKNYIEPNYCIIEKRRDDIRNQIQLQQYEHILSDDLCTYLFNHSKLLQSQLEDAYWYADWSEWRRWLLENEAGDLRVEIDSFRDTVGELQEKVTALENRRAIKLADSVHALFSK